MNWFQKRKRIISAIVILLVCIGLFLPWGQARLEGAIKVGEVYSNPIWVEGAYPRGIANSLKEFSNELAGFQNECEMVEMGIMMVLIFLATLDLIYVVCMLAGTSVSYYIGIIAECLVVLLLVAAILLAFMYQNDTLKFGEKFRIVTNIRLNIVPFLLVLFEIIGKNACSAKKID